MSKIDFEEDQTKMLGKTENIQSLADQVEKLNTLDQQVESLEKDLKQKKKDFEYLSGEVIPTMMAEMGLSQLKLMDQEKILSVKVLVIKKQTHHTLMRP